MLVGAMVGLVACQSTGPYPSEGVSPIFSFPIMSNETPYTQYLAALRKVSSKNKPVFSVQEAVQDALEELPEVIDQATATANSSWLILNNSDASALIGQESNGDQSADADSEPTTTTTTADEVSNILNTQTTK